MMSRCEETEEEVKTGKLQADTQEMNMVLPGGATGKAGAWLVPRNVRELGGYLSG